MSDLEPSSPPSLEAPRRAESGATRAAGIAGKILIGAGTLLLLFVVFQIFGTTYIQQQHQNSLRSSIDATHTLDTVPSTVANLPPVTVPTRTPPGSGAPVAVIAIPKINLNQVVVQDTQEGDLELGPGHYTDTPLPGENGNVGIAGHRTTWGRPFYNLDQMKRGDPIYIATDRGTFVYSVTSSQVVDPTDLAVLDPTTGPTLTLTTCNPKYSAAQRLVVKATLTETIFSLSLHVAPASSGGATTTTRPSPAPSSSTALMVIALGALTVALCLGAWLAARRFARPWLLYLVAAPFILVSLFAFFSALSSHLPAGF